MENHTMTLDELARMIQGEFTAVRDEFTAVRGEMRTGFDAVHETLKRHDDEFVRVHEEFVHMHEEIKTLRKDMETGFHGFAMILKSIHEDIQDFKKVKIEVAELRHRVERLETKLGIVR